MVSVKIDHRGVVQTQTPSGEQDTFTIDLPTTVNGSNVVLDDNIERTDWYVDSVDGSDENDGSISSPLQSLTGLYKKIHGRVLVNDTTFWLSGDFTGQQLALSCFVSPGKTMTIRGDVEQTHSGVFSAFTAWNAATAQISVVNDGGVTDYASFIGHFMRMTSGPANGNSAPIVKAVAPGQARPGIFTSFDGVKATPVNGNTFVVENVITKIGGIDLGGVVGEGGNRDLFIPRVLVRDLEIYNPSQDLVFGRGAYIGTYVYRVRFGGTHFQEFADANVTLTSTYNVSGVQLVFRSGWYFLYGHCDAEYINVLGGRVFNQEDLIHQGGGMGVAACGQVTTVAPHGFFDVAGADNCLALEQGGNYSASQSGGRIWGSGNTVTHGIRIRSGCTLEYVTKPTVTGTNDTIIGGDIKTYAQVPFAQIDLAKGYGAALVLRG